MNIAFATHNILIHSSLVRSVASTEFWSPDAVSSELLSPFKPASKFSAAAFDDITTTVGAVPDFWFPLFVDVSSCGLSPV